MDSRRSMVAIMAAVFLAAAAFHPSPGRAAAADLETVARGGTAFTLNLYRQLAAQEKGNIFFSPYSISLALGMTYAGAKGETAAQMARVLGFTLPPDRLHPALAELSRHLQKVGNEGGQVLSLANAVWLNTVLKLQPAYLKLIGDYYSNEMEQLDFCQEAQAQKTINDWVSRKTKEHIKDLIPQGVLNCRTMLVLTNAVYFLGEWADKFDQEQTKPGPFWPAPDQQVETPFMHRTGKYAYAEAEGWQVLRLPYLGERLSMLVLLPKDKGALAQQAKGLNPEMLARLTRDLRLRQVKVTFPKFEAKTSYNLTGDLKNLGMPLAFGLQADFRGITTQRQLRIDLVLHKAWVKVEEKGTEAAAATAVVMVEKAAPMPVPLREFKADHPFLYCIQDRETGLILFWGRLSNPQAG